MCKPQLIASEAELKSLVKQAKEQGCFQFSNYFPNTMLHKKWIVAGSLYYVKIKSTFFLLHDRKSYREILFLGTDSYTVSESLNILTSELKLPALAEYITKTDKCELLLPITARLKRMSRIGRPICANVPRNVLVCGTEDIAIIVKIFEMYFHPAMERVPDNDEITDWVENGSIGIIKNEKGTIVGMIVIELVGTSLQLRYWWVHPEHRNKGNGSALFAWMFKTGENTMRQYLWVFDDNKNAIKRYRHYGFDFDGVTDSMVLFE